MIVEIYGKIFYIWSLMETNKLLHFITVYETQNLRKAAEVLSMSHSALSKSLKTLEIELGQRLFTPLGRGLTHTEEARRIYEKSKNILEQTSSLFDIEHEAIGLKIKIGTFEVFSTYFLQLLKEAFTENEMELHEITHGKLEKAVATGIVDFGITYEPIPHGGVEFLKISQIKMAPFVKQGAFKNQALLDIPFAVPLQPLVGAPSGVKGLDGWPENLFPRHRKYQVDMLESAIELCRQGECAIFIPEFMAKLHNNVVLKEFKLEKRLYPGKMKQVKRTVYLIKRSNSEETAEMKKVCRFLRSIP